MNEASFFSLFYHYYFLFPKKEENDSHVPPSLTLLSRRGKFIIIFEREREENILVVEKEKEGTFEAVDVAKTQALFHIDALSIFHGNRVPGQTRIYQRVRWYVAS